MGLVEKIGKAGVVGCGGAGYPSQGKLKGAFEYFIINGAECEPLLRNDRYLMLNKAHEIVKAAMVIQNEMNIPKCFISLKDHYKDEIEALQKAIDEERAPIEICRLGSYYPAGDKQVIVYETTGIVIPPAGSTGKAGVLLYNVGTVYEIYHALNDRPFIYKYLTVTGEVKHPVIVKAPIGTSVRDCIALAGGVTVSDYTIINGGPMMGKPTDEDSPITKTTSALIVLPSDTRVVTNGNTLAAHMLNRAKSACIQCSYCTQLCPRHLLGHPLEPHRIMRKMALGNDITEMLDDKIIQSASLCCDCGVCEIYACPMGLQPRKINGIIKSELKKAGIRYTPDVTECAAESGRDEKRIPTDRLAARAGVEKYNSYEIRGLAVAAPEVVAIPMKMHSGAPCTPCVHEGDRVRIGDLIGSSDDGVGTSIHASISGHVVSVSDTVIIEKDER